MPSKKHLLFLAMEGDGIELTNIKVSDKNVVGWGAGPLKTIIFTGALKFSWFLHKILSQQNIFKLNILLFMVTSIL